jgi:heptosyltransferase-2
MNILIVKLGATGDVVRTTSLLNALKGDITWITAAKNISFIQNLSVPLRALSWEENREDARDRKYELVISLEDEVEVGAFLQGVKADQWFGAYLDSKNTMCYTKSSHRWFDLSLISSFGRENADRLKLQNRYTYQALVFDGLGFTFSGEKYLLPPAVDTGLKGDIALATESGPVWPMKKWAFYDQLKIRLESAGFKVNVLPKRPTLLEHLSDVQSHRCLVSGDTLPMHLALGSNVKCVSIFTCTSPWEIYDYGLQVKHISPLLDQFFYKRGFDERATTAVTLDEINKSVEKQIAG